MPMGTMRHTSSAAMSGTTRKRFSHVKAAVDTGNTRERATKNRAARARDSTNRRKGEAFVRMLPGTLADLVLHDHPEAFGHELEGDLEALKEAVQILEIGERKYGGGGIPKIPIRGGARSKKTAPVISKKSRSGRHPTTTAAAVPFPQRARRAPVVESDSESENEFTRAAMEAEEDDESENEFTMAAREAAGGLGEDFTAAEYEDALQAELDALDRLIAAKKAEDAAAEEGAAHRGEIRRDVTSSPQGRSTSFGGGRSSVGDIFGSAGDHEILGKVPPKAHPRPTSRDAAHPKPSSRGKDSGPSTPSHRGMSSGGGASSFSFGASEDHRASPSPSSSRRSSFNASATNSGSQSPSSTRGRSSGGGQSSVGGLLGGGAEVPDYKRSTRAHSRASGNNKNMSGVFGRSGVLEEAGSPKAQQKAHLLSETRRAHLSDRSHHHNSFAMSDLGPSQSPTPPAHTVPKQPVDFSPRRGPNRKSVRVPDDQLTGAASHTRTTDRKNISTVNLRDPTTSEASREAFHRSVSERDVLVIDVRSEEEFEKGHIFGAIHFPAKLLRRSTNHFTPEMMMFRGKKNKFIVVYDNEGENGALAHTAANVMAARGLSPIHALVGGFRRFSGTHSTLVDGEALVYQAPEVVPKMRATRVKGAAPASSAGRRAKQAQRRLDSARVRSSKKNERPGTRSLI